MGPLRRAASGAALAVSFLTIVPVRVRGQVAGLGAAAAWFPLVGALVGGAAGAVRYLAEPVLGPSVAAILAVATLVVLTGALHQDGLADCADGLGVRGDRERRLAVMRDSATGAFGVLALLGWSLLLTSALAELTREEALRALVTAALAGRWAALLHARATPPARRDGLGARFDVAPIALLAASATALAGALLLDGQLHGLAALAAAALVAAGTSVWARAGLGGRTGDTLGATVALAEVAVCLTLLGFATA
ncbi:MAG TPA: adenosylcobinamide-GDP ribazoletransferase [Conexibacter sp.]|nr:adenosylcobinamide-GDP ribazoletransferase [Conexibacter sp.]